MEKPKSLTIISTFTIILALITIITSNKSIVDAQQEPIEEVEGGGDSLERFTCSNGERPPTGDAPNEVINFNAIETEDGTTGEFRISGVSNPEGPSLGTKEGEINTIDISGNQFILTGVETSDTLCHDDTPAEVTISGECEPEGNSLFAEISFEAQNGEEGTFSVEVECVDNDDIPLTEQFKNQGQCIKFAKENHESGITEEDCKMAFQNKFNILVLPR